MQTPMKPLMIHEIKPEYFKLNLEQYELTFDDALYSQFYYWPLFKNIRTKKILFVSTSLIQMTDLIRPQIYTAQGNVRISREFPSCYEAMAKWENDLNNEDYMTLGELKVLMKDGLEIGAHSHMHIREYSSDLIMFLKEFKKDTEFMISWFIKNLGFRPILYCFPFNREREMMKYCLERDYRFKTFYGADRLDIEDLI
jgi:hypothetical protein